MDKRYTATTSGRVRDRLTNEQVAQFQPTADGLRKAMKVADLLNEA